MRVAIHWLMQSWWSAAYSQMFPDRVGRMVLDGLEFVVDHRELMGFGWTSLDNVTDSVST